MDRIYIYRMKRYFNNKGIYCMSRKQWPSLRYFRLNIICLQSKIILVTWTQLDKIVLFNTLGRVTTSWTYSSTTSRCLVLFQLWSNQIHNWKKGLEYTILPGFPPGTSMNLYVLHSVTLSVAHPDTHSLTEAQVQPFFFGLKVKNNREIHIFSAVQFYLKSTLLIVKNLCFFQIKYLFL